ncbi:aldose 1-epimerase [Sodalis sp. RH24]|uniref:aldose 1-epimerase n=1 Tax=unclassified Sodalis (in: enterobacteria) TaxID=2636512 RepID=UPI0039B6300A
MNSITLSNEALVLRCRAQGGAVLSLATRSGIAILRPARDPLAPPGECTLFPMLPLANRVEGNAFNWRGRTITFPRSPWDERFFLHGDGWLSAWTVADSAPDAVAFSLSRTLTDICRYRAQLSYQLRDHALLATLSITNTDAQPFPFGLGFHPFFCKTPAMTLWFQARGYWPERAHHLPADWREEVPSGWDFATPRLPGAGWMNNAFSGWTGRAVLHDAGSGATVTLDSATDILMVYQPQNSDFICLEPQTHPVNAHNQPGMPGLAVLAPGGTLRLAMRIGWAGTTARRRSSPG